MNNPHYLNKKGLEVKYQLPFKSFSQFVSFKASTHSTKPAIIFDNFEKGKKLTISYELLDKQTVQISSFLKSKGLKLGNSVSFSFANTPEIILINYAAWRSGMVSVPLNVRRDTVERKIYKLKQTKAKLLFTRSDKESRKENREILKALPKLKIIETNNYQDFVKSISNSTNISNSVSNTQNLKLNSTCLILFTSGTTALPKGVELTLDNLFANAESIIEWLKLSEDERFKILLPLHHINSTTFANATLLVGGTVILTPKYSKSLFWEIMARNKVTCTSIVPTIAYDLIDEQKSFARNREGLKQTRKIQIGSAPVQPKVVEKFYKQYNIPLYQGYGQTETSLRSTGIPANLTNNQYLEIVMMNSLGIQLKYTNVTVLDKKGSQAKEDELGEICIRGPIVMKGYMNNPKATKEAFKYGWLHSGDTGYWKMMYERKFFFITGRNKEIIKKAGTLISPLAIENTLLANYSELEKVYAIGFPDLRLGQEIGIVAVTKSEKVLDRIIEDGKKGKISNLTTYESPMAALAIDESKLPKTSTGKVQRIKINKLFADILLQKSRVIAKSNKHTFRIIGSEENEVLTKAVEVNNKMWSSNLKSTLDEFIQRSKNGVLIGAFDTKEVLVGTVSVLRIDRSKLQRSSNKNHRKNTWNGITGSGTFSTNNHKGNSLVCPAISAVSSQKSKGGSSTPPMQIISSRLLKDYLKSDKDYVIRFHRKAKGGQTKGGQIVKIIPKGRPKDMDSLGYNVLIKYPKINKIPKMSHNTSVGVQLMEAVMIYASHNRIKDVYAYSRPAGLSKHFRPN